MQVGKFLIINVNVGLRVIPLKFGTFFGACVKCNGCVHYVKECHIQIPKVNKEGEERGNNGEAKSNQPEKSIPKAM